MLALASLALLAAQPGSAARALTLDDALTEAARANADVLLARAGAELADVDAYASYAGVLPRLDLSATFGHTFLGAQRTPIGFGLPPVQAPATDQPTYSLGATLQLPIFDGGRNWNAVRRARTGARAAELSLDETRLGVAFEVMRRFYVVVKAQETLGVLDETVSRSEGIVRRAEALFEAGRGSRADLLSAAGNLGNDRIALEQQRARVAQALADLAVLLGRDAGALVEVTPPQDVMGPGLPSAEEPPPQDALLERARRARPLLAAQAEGVRSAQIGEAVARGAWWPVVAAQASYSRSGSEFSGGFGVYGDPAKQYSATAELVVSLNLFDGRRTVADEQRASIGTRRARVQAAQAEQQVSSEIARARASVVALARAAALAADNLATARQGVALATARLEAGAATQLEVRDASLKLTQAQLSLVEARVDHVVARADLNRAVGGAL